MEGIAWKPMSAQGAMWISGGTTNVLSMALIPQYNILIRTSSGAEHNESVFLIRNSCGDSVISASKPKMNVNIAIDRPMMVRYCKCHP